jgi:hypothetical protein
MEIQRVPEFDAILDGVGGERVWEDGEEYWKLMVGEFEVRMRYRVRVGGPLCLRPDGIEVWLLSACGHREMAAMVLRIAPSADWLFQGMGWDEAITEAQDEAEAVACFSRFVSGELARVRGLNGRDYLTIRRLRQSGYPPAQVTQLAALALAIIRRWSNTNGTAQKRAGLVRGLTLIRGRSIARGLLLMNGSCGRRSGAVFRQDLRDYGIKRDWVAEAGLWFRGRSALDTRKIASTGRSFVLLLQEVQ